MSYRLKCGNIEWPAGYGLGDSWNAGWTSNGLNYPQTLALAKSGGLDWNQYSGPNCVTGGQVDNSCVAQNSAIESAWMDAKAAAWGTPAPAPVIPPSVPVPIRRIAPVVNQGMPIRYPLPTFNPQPLPPVQHIEPLPIIQQQPIVTIPTPSPTTGTVQMPPGTSTAAVPAPGGFSFSAIPWWGWLAGAGAAYFAFAGGGRGR
jgi:hypothetical protein